jgi:co-chaperonin GroES (HSP10)
MQIKPVGHYILVQPEKLEEHDEVYKRAMASGIQIAKEHTLKERVAISQGKIIAVGPTAWKDYSEQPWAKVGDTVAYARHGGMYVKDPQTKEDYLILNDEDICAVLS